MKKFNNERTFEQSIQNWHDDSFAIEYRKLITIDETRSVPVEELEDLFVSYLNGFLDLALNELRAKYKKLEFKETYEGYIVTVIITKQEKSFFKKRK